MKKNTKGGIGINKVWLESPVELARLACNFNTNNKDLLSYKEDKHTVLMLPGEKIGNTTLAYCALSEANADTMNYQNVGYESINFEKTESVNSYLINIISIDPSSFIEKKIDWKKTNAVRLEQCEDLVRCLVKKSIENEYICNALVFRKDGKTVIMAFDVLENLSDERTIFYAVSDNEIKGCFARYKYSDNKIDFSDEMSDHTYMYVKLIYLKEPFSFFNALMPE